MRSYVILYSRFGQEKVTTVENKYDCCSAVEVLKCCLTDECAGFFSKQIDDKAKMVCTAAIKVRHPFA